MDEHCGGNHSHRPECICKNMEEDPVHILVPVIVMMAMVVSVSVAMLERHDAHDVYSQPGNTDDQQFINPVHLTARE